MMIDILKHARRVSVPLVVASSPDMANTIREVRAVFEPGSPMPLIQWDICNGLTALNEAGSQVLTAVLKADPPALPGGKKALNSPEWPAMTQNPGAALQYMAEFPGELRRGDQIAQRGTMVFMLNAQRFIEDRAGSDNVVVIQGIWNLRDAYKSNRRTLIMMGPGVKLPTELMQDCLSIDEPLPSEADLERIVKTQVADIGLPDLEPGKLAAAVDAVRGMSAFAAEQIVAMSCTKAGIDTDMLWTRKIGIIEQTEGLSVDRGAETLEDTRGVANFVEFGSSLIAAEDAPVLYVRCDEIEKSFGGLGGDGGPGDSSGTTQDRLGVMLRKMEDNGWTGFISVGHAGCGKTLTSKALANSASKRTGRRVLSVAMDLGALSGSLVGESERKVRTAMKVLESLAGIGGRVCFIATCNDLKILPPALKRRFKLGTWMFDLPERAEKDAVWKLMLPKFGHKPDAKHPDDTDWTPSDIRNVCETAKLLSCSLDKAVQFTTFVAKSDPGAVNRLRRVAHGKFVSAHKPGTYMMPERDVPVVDLPTEAQAGASGRLLGEER